MVVILTQMWEPIYLKTKQEITLFKKERDKPLYVIVDVLEGLDPDLLLAHCWELGSSAFCEKSTLSYTSLVFKDLTGNREYLKRVWQTTPLFLPRESP